MNTRPAYYIITPDEVQSVDVTVRENDNVEVFALSELQRKLCEHHGLR